MKINRNVGLGLVFTQLWALVALTTYAIFGVNPVMVAWLAVLALAWTVLFLSLTQELPAPAVLNTAKFWLFQVCYLLGAGFVLGVMTYFKS